MDPNPYQSPSTPGAPPPPPTRGNNRPIELFAWIANAIVVAAMVAILVMLGSNQSNPADMVVSSMLAVYGLIVSFLVVVVAVNVVAMLCRR